MTACDSPHAALIGYADALDDRNWDQLAALIAPDVRADYGDAIQLADRDALIHMIRTVLGPCGPTQHLLGNFTVDGNGDSRQVCCQVRAYHASAGGNPELFYEISAGSELWCGRWMGDG